MNYKKHYDLLIEKANKRVLLNGYTEKHHVVPKCMGGTNNKENLVCLTAREHYISHWLLHKIYPDNRKLIYALHRMMYGITTCKNIIIPSRDYSKIRKMVSEACTGKGNGFYNHKHTDKQKKLWSTKRKGYKHREEDKQKIRDTQKGKSHRWLYKIINPDGVVVNNYESVSLVSICEKYDLVFKTFIKYTIYQNKDYKGWLAFRKPNTCINTNI